MYDEISSDDILMLMGLSLIFVAAVKMNEWKIRNETDCEHKKTQQRFSMH